MKNIHILPTDNPSRLYLHSNNELQLRTNIIRTSEDYLGTNQNIYITSNEEIKVGDWCIDKHSVVYKQETDKIFTEFTGAKKIILTTDFTLAPDVHKIPDEFLEWFVKNPSCEEVGVELKTKQLVRPYDVYNETVSYYKIIIPQEEPKQEYKYIGECKGNNDNGCFIESPGHDCGCFKRIQQKEPKQLTDLEIAMKLEELDREEAKQETTGKEFYESADAVITVSKQETLEEEAEKYSREVWGVYYDDVHPDIAITQTQGEISVKDFSRGAKWQARRMYSEGEVLQLLLRLQQTESYDNLYDWFQQYKKK
jgi:hypothetical protein